MSWFKRKNKNIDPSAGIDESSTEESSVSVPLKKMEDARTEILRSSKEQLTKMRLLAMFFNNDTLIKIVEQTDFIYSIFEKNADLNYKKLEQFNYYYVDNIIELLQKLKKSREENIIILNEKLTKCSSKIEQLSQSSYNAKTNLNTQKRWTSDVSEHLVQAYRWLCDPNVYKLDSSKKLKTLLQILENENHYFLKDQEFDEMSDSDEDFYKSKIYSVQRRLMGKLNKNVFNIEFKYAFKSESNMELYLFQIKDTLDWFVYVPSRDLFKLIESSKILKHVEVKNSWLSKNEKLRHEEQEKHESLKTHLSKQKSIHEPELLSMLQKFLDKINDTDLLNDLSSIDMDRKFLEDVLKLEQFKI